METKQKVWIGDVPGLCDLCQNPIIDIFIDGRLKAGPWANMCPRCHEFYGCGLGTGNGQKYQQQDGGQWLKIEG